MSEYRKNPIQDLNEKKNTPEFRVLIIGFLLLVLTSFLFFFGGNERITFVMLCLSFSTYPVSEFIGITRKKEKYILKLEYPLLLLHSIWMVCCFIACFDKEFLIYSGICFFINLYVIIFRSFLVKKLKNK